MEIALDKNGKRVVADDANKETEYFCPVCKQGVLFKKGTEKIPHFAHLPNCNCTDNWEYDMSEWHRNWQDEFPEESRENIVVFAGHVHRADVLLNNSYVIEVQHSHLSVEDVTKRMFFYTQAGFNMIWLFDVRDQYKKKYITFYKNKNNVDWYRWDWASKTIGRAISLKKLLHTRVDVVLQLEDNLFLQTGWSAQHDNCSRFSAIDMDKNSFLEYIELSSKKYKKQPEASTRYCLS